MHACCSIARHVPTAAALLLILPDAGLDFVFHMFFLIKYSKSLEEGERSRLHGWGSVKTQLVAVREG